MERYIECKTQEQWGTVIKYLNEKYSQTTRSRLNAKNAWEDYKENTILADDGTEIWMYCNKDFYLGGNIKDFISFEEFCKQEGINMEKKSTDYCFKSCEEFKEWIKEYDKDKRDEETMCISGSFLGDYYYNDDAKLHPKSWDYRSRIPEGLVEITWQEFKQLFIDKTMKTTQEELDELKAKVKELEDKVKKENELNVGDIRIALSKLSYCEEGNYFHITKIVGTNPKDKVYFSHDVDNEDYITYESVIKYSKKVTESEYQEYLISEAKKRGYTSKNVIKPLWKTKQNEWTIAGNNFTYYSEHSDNFTDDSTIKKDLLYLGGCPIYWAGNWAEIVKEKNIEISGYKAKFDKVNKTVSFGCKKDITKKDLEAILTVMKLNEKFDSHFEIGDAVVTSPDNEDFSGEISKETIQELIKGLE